MCVCVRVGGHALPHVMCKVAGNGLIQKQTQHVVACDVGVGSVGGSWTSGCDRTLWVGQGEPTSSMNSLVVSSADSRERCVPHG